jgi:hypothetical protein
MAVEFKYGDYIKAGWGIVKANLVTSIVMILVIAVGSFLAVGALIAPQMIINYMKGVKEAKASGKPIEIGALFAFDNFVNNLIAMFIAGLFAMCFGLPFCLVYFTAPILADHPGIGFMDAVKGALAFGKSNLVPRLILMIILGVVGGIGGVACGLGVFITYPIMFAAQWLAYEEHKAAITAAAAEAGVTLA